MPTLIQLPVSPFARKARVLIHEMNLESLVECVDFGLVSPVSLNEDVLKCNPLGMIPTLILDNEESLYDSAVICEYLDVMGKGGFFPNEFEERFPALKLQALADGMLDAAVALRYELAMRPIELHWPEWIDHQTQRIKRAVSEFENQLPLFSDHPTIGEVTVACALGYLDFRYSELNWREEHVDLDNWFAKFSQRTSMINTIPEDGTVTN